MSKPQIHKSLLTITLIPISIMTLISAIYFVFINAPNTEKAILKQISTYANYLSKASEYSVLTGNFDIIQPQIKLISDNPAINRIKIYDEYGNILTTAESIQEIEKNHLFILFHQLFRKSQNTLFKNIITDPIELYDYSDAQVSSTQKIGQLVFEINNDYVFYKKYILASYGFYISVIIYLFALYGALRFSRKITNGIEDIDKTLHDIESGNFYARVNNNLVDKFGGIGDGIEKMADAINITDQHLREKIEKATYKLHAYNKEIIKNNRKLSKARELAEEANAAKTNFLANISHEIRTPVNGIIGFTDLLLSANIKDEHKLCIQNIDEASNKLIHLINDLLDFSKLEAGHVQTQISRIDIYDLAAKLHAFYSVNSKNKDVDIYLHIEPNTPRYIFTDEYKLEQIITNLLSNAIKFTANGFVKIEINSYIQDNDNCKINLSISDSGIGIADKDQKNIFKKFEQADMTTSRQYGGSGLGLSIAALLAKNLNGSIKLSSALGRGSTFTLSLSTQYEISSFDMNLKNIQINYYDEDSYHQQYLSNLLTSLGCKVNIISYDDAFLPSDKILICGFKNEESANNYAYLLPKDINKHQKCIGFFSFYNQAIYKNFQKHGFQHNSLRTYRLHSLINILESKKSTDTNKQLIAENHITALIVDDNKINVMLLERYLQKLGVHTISSLCGLEALQILKNITPDIILTDLHMPRISGIDLTLKIRSKYEKLKNTPIIAITADGAISNHQKAINNGIQEVLLKPVSFEIIMEKLIQYTNIELVEGAITDDNMQNNDIYTMLIKELPVFSNEINNYLKNNDLKQLYQTVHRLVGGLEYCPDQKHLLDKAKIAYKAIKDEEHSVHNIKGDIDNLLDEINTMTN